MKPDFIKAGADCVARNGQRAHIYAVVRNGKYNVHGEIEGCSEDWTADGIYYDHPQSSGGWDLVGPWVEQKAGDA